MKPECPNHRSLLAGVVILFLSGAWRGVEAAQTGYWTNTTGGRSWTSTANWTNCPGAYPGAPGDAAYLTATQSAAHPILVDSSIALGQLVVENDGYILVNPGGTNTVTFDNQGSGALFRLVATGGLDNATWISNGIVVADNWNVEHYGNNEALNFMGDVVGGADKRIDIIYDFSGGTPSIAFQGSNANYLGTVNVRGIGNQMVFGLQFSKAGQMFGGPTGSVRLVSLAAVRITYAISDADARKLAFAEDRNTLTLVNLCVFTNVQNSENYIPRGGFVVLGDSSSAISTNRWPDADPVPLLGASFTLNGRNTASVIESIGDVTFEHGCRLSVRHNGGADMVTHLLPASLTRADVGALVIVSTGGDLGSASNQLRVAGATVPLVTNGMTAPYYVTSVNESGLGTVGDFVTYGANGFAPVACDLTNDLAGATAASKVSVTSALNLAGQAVECYALRAGGKITNGQVRIHGGGLILGNADHTADFSFGAASNSEALVYLSGNRLNVRSTLYGGIAASNLTKFGTLSVTLSGANTSLFGTVTINEGGLVFARTNAINEWNDLVLGYSAVAGIGTNVSVAGLRGMSTAGVTTNGLGARVLALHPGSGTTNVFPGAIGGDGLSLRVDGPGCQALSGTNAYGGGTAINGGELQVQGLVACAGVSVNAGGLLGGSGAINGIVTVASNGVLSAGGAGVAGTLTINSNTVLETGAVVNWEGGAGVDLLDINGKLTLPAVATVNVSSLGGALPSKPILFTEDTIDAPGGVRRWTIVGMPGFRADIEGNTVVLGPQAGTVITVL